MCSVHSKDLEAFCENDKVVLCVSCIIENDHKNHDLSSIDKAAQKEKTVIQSTINNLGSIRRQVADGLNDVCNIFSLITVKANKNIKAVDEFFQQIIYTLNERKELLRNRIATQLEMETEAIKKLEDYINKQLLKIDEFIDANSKIDDKTDLEILSSAKVNNQSLGLILSDFPKHKKEEEIKFYELNKTEEITYLKVILNKFLVKDGSSPENYESNKRNTVKLLEFNKVKGKQIRFGKTNSLKFTPDINSEKYCKQKLSNKMTSPLNLDRRIARPEIPRELKPKRQDTKSRSSKQIAVSILFNKAYPSRW
jgi:hypothetical protein